MVQGVASISRPDLDNPEGPGYGPILASVFVKCCALLIVLLRFTSSRSEKSHRGRVNTFL
uniref:Uncharacterized protein n=1 Tax=Hyaloperonospora arabidopsidis (strain Emoy2) TaxID=559515 RepID=M4BES2_HYAAE